LFQGLCCPKLSSGDPMPAICRTESSSLRAASSPNLRFFRWWAAILLVVTLAIGPLMVFTYGAVSFGALFALSVREMRKGNRQPEDTLNALLMLLTMIWFGYNLGIELYAAYFGEQVLELFIGIIALAYLYPPLIMHISYLEERVHVGPASHWLPPVYLVYAFGGLGALTLILLGLGFIRTNGNLLAVYLQGLLFLLFILALVYSAVVAAKTRRKPNRRERSYRRLYVIMVALAVVVFLTCLIMLWKSMLLDMRLLARIMLISRSLPICFLFVGVYYQRRFTFFDVFIKRGTYLFLLFLLLVGYFVLVVPVVERSRVVTGRSWFFAVALLPLLLALPWCYRRLDAWLDRAWLGRSYSTVEAVKFFLNGIQDATTQDELIKHAQNRLSDIFQAGASIVLDSQVSPQSPTPGMQQALILNHGQCVGAIRMGPRPNDTPYFSADVSLLGSLADVFSSLLENVRLQQKKQEQEKREQDLRLNASRSELKALRAQINPHFLFNALNAIAGLIHKDPSRAEETVEQLAEVFRYTLKRSEKEWVRLEDELDFVRSYLEVEQARFGERLVVRMEVDDEVRHETIPTMMIQTLVENAVKHGVASVKGTGIIEIRARRLAARVRIEVSDNGPGFPSQEAFGEGGKSKSGYGLKNLRQRLSAHHGSAAELRVSRDAEHQMTTVTVEMPAHPASVREVEIP
jgi:anti-sigma regulatory factor (Ser/Thr protein kinase)